MHLIYNRCNLVLIGTNPNKSNKKSYFKLLSVIDGSHEALIIGNVFLAERTDFDAFLVLFQAGGMTKLSDVKTEPHTIFTQTLFLTLLLAV